MSDSPKTAPATRLRLAVPADTPALARLLPAGLSNPMHTRYLVAEESAGKLLGAAYLTALSTAQGETAAMCRFAVCDGCAEDQIAPLLLKGCIAQAKFHGVQTLIFDGRVQEGNPIEKLLQAHGFAPTQTLAEYVMDGAAALAACDRAWRAIERRGGMPADGRAIPLRDAPLHAVRALISRYLGPVGDLNWRRPASRIHPDVSTVVQIGPRVVGAVIVRHTDQPTEAEAPWDVVDEDFRAGWVTIALWRRTSAKGLEAGFKTVRFRTNEEQFAEFARFAKRMGSRQLGRETRYSLVLEAQS